MRWKTKAAIQNLVARLPSELSYSVYFWLQRRFGNLRRIDPVQKLTAAGRIGALAARHGRGVRNAAVLEIGTGRRISLPLGLWLLGAARVTTVDLNPYLRHDLVMEDIASIVSDRRRLAACFLDLQIDASRLDRLAALSASGPSLEEVLESCNITYISPGDARNMDLPAGSIDLQVSFNVLEHIPPSELRAILCEGTRLLSSRGLAIHRVDYSDHFSHTDATISSINFLQYDDHAWNRFADNRYMYMNRLRVDDVEALFSDAELNILSVDSTVDEHARTILDDPSFEIAARFRDKPREILATIDSWITARPGATGGRSPEGTA